ncbi:putative GRF zinc finger protein isoform X3 [Senna tora]|uniref:Putative GRF zinc finger protein isoform X3 n=1 Tax=Senna tora TaxID=362788 RepID=A0A834WFT8_9FABA|nr:putative GRF zinc finger protein isoform X3 [Senna tora]
MGDARIRNDKFEDATDECLYKCGASVYSCYFNCVTREILNFLACAAEDAEEDDKEEIDLAKLPIHAKSGEIGDSKTMANPNGITVPPTTPPTRSGRCFKCDQPGHWYRQCPGNLRADDSRRYPMIHCQCGYGHCQVKTRKRGFDGGNKDYYLCPIKRGKKCTFLRCEQATKERIECPPPPYKYPECGGCGAGVCRREKVNRGPNAGRYYFTCPLRKGHGSCGFFLWEENLRNAMDNVKTETSHVNENNDEGLGEGGDLHIDHRDEIAERKVPMGGMEHDETAKLSTPPKSVGFPEFKITDDLLDMDMDSVSWIPLRRMHIVPKKENMPPGSSCSKFYNLEHLKKNEAITSQGEFCRLKLEIEVSKGLLSDILSLFQTRFSNISPSIVASDAAEKASDGATPQHDSLRGLS